MGSGLTNISPLPVISEIAVITGSATTPSISFLNDLDTGLYQVAANILSFAIGGSGRYSLGSNGFYGISSDTNGIRIASASQISLASEASLTISIGTAGSLLILAYDPGAGIGSVWFCVYTNTAFRLAATTSTAATDSAGTLCVFKSANSHTVTLRNRLGSTKNIRIAILGAQV